LRYIDLMKKKLAILTFAVLCTAVSLNAQQYPKGLIDKTVAIVGNEVITLSEIETELRMQRANGMASDQSMRCSQLEQMMEQKLFIAQAKVDSLTVNNDMVTSNLNDRIDYLRQALGGDAEVEKYFGKPLYKLRQEWRSQLEDVSLYQQEQSEVASSVPDLTPADVKEYIANTPAEDMPMVPIKYQLHQIVMYPDREKAGLAVKEKLLAIRERIINGEKFATLARIYSEDPGSARKGGELGMAPKSVFWGSFSDAAMSLRPGVISQIVETPDGYHLIEIIDKQGDMFNARHILMKPQYSAQDREKAFKTLDSLRTEILNGAVTFDLAARFYSQDPSTRTNGGQVADPSTGSSYLEIDQLKPQDYAAIKNLKEGEISKPVESLDNEGRGNTIYKIIKVDKIIPAHAATFDNDYSQLLSVAKNKKAQEAIDKFIDEKVSSTYIVIDPIFKDCDFSREAWKKVAAKSAE